MLLSFIVFAASINISLPVKAEGTNPSVYINPSNTQAVYTYDGYYVVFNLNGSWPGGHNVGIQIYNTGSETIEDWTLESDYSNNISNIWNSSVIENGNGVTKLYYDTWNSVIYPNSCVEFGYSSNESFVSFPTYFGILGSEIIETGSDLYSIDFIITNDWGEGYTGEIIITNNTDKPIEDWRIEFDFINTIDSVWGGIIESEESGHYVIKNADYNSIINANNTTSIGFIVSSGNSGDLFENAKLYEISRETTNEEIEIEEPYIAEPFADIGEIYMKDFTEEDIVFDEESGLRYIRNQLLVSAFLGTPNDAIQEIANEINANIVGYIEITCDYQFEFSNSLSLDELMVIAEYIEGYPYISDVSLNFVSEISSYTDDALYTDNITCHRVDIDTDYDGVNDWTYAVAPNPNRLITSQDCWDENCPYGDNWGLEAIKADSAWSLINDSTTVKVGIVDYYFEDVYDNGKGELIFDDIHNSLSFDSLDYDIEHGNHVAGIIGARKDNKIGISGVATDVKLYGYSYKANAGSQWSLMNYKIAFTTLIVNHVKVINFSVGFADQGMIYAATYDYGKNGIKARAYIKNQAVSMSNHFNKMLMAGYDFLIVAAAGNDNEKEIIKDDNPDRYGYRVKNSTDTVAAEPNLTGLKAEYSSVINAITQDINANVYDHIIVVGSCDNVYKYSDFSKIGDRVDVVAPGENILSTIPHNMYSSTFSDYEILDCYNIMSGTSMATPFVTGIAALMYEVKPSISARKVKLIISNNEYKRKDVSDAYGNSYYFPDASQCVAKAQSITDTPGFDNNYPSGLIAGKTIDSSNNPIDYTDILAIRHNTGEFSLDKYYYRFSSDQEGDFICVLPQGTYDILFCKENPNASEKSYLPLSMYDIEVNPDENTELGNIILSEWKSSIGNSVNGKIIDAITGEPIEGAEIRIRKGWDNKNGKYVSTITGDIKSDYTDEYGYFIIGASLGAYTVEIIKDGYINGFYNLVADKKEGMTFSLSPVLDENEYRVVLTWGDIPSDLDSHLFWYNEYDQEMFHVYWANRTGYYNGEIVASLDVDDTSSYGPETVTITFDASMVENGGELRYCVNNYTRGSLGELSESNATVRVYKGNELEKTLNVTKNQEAYVWHVFKISNEGLQTEYIFDESIY
jgi:subtilisin family serine protease